jgi:hypothetical protein
MTRRSREFEEDMEFLEGVLFNDSYLSYLIDEVYPPGTFGSHSSVATSLYRDAAAVHGENLELILKYQAVLVGRLRLLSPSGGDSERRALLAKADVAQAALTETVEILAGLDARGYSAPRWHAALCDGWFAIFEPIDDALFEGPIRISA